MKLTCLISISGRARHAERDSKVKVTVVAKCRYTTCTAGTVHRSTLASGHPNRVMPLLTPTTTL